MNTSFDSLIDLFEDELRSGKSPDVDEFLSRFPEDSRQQATAELVALDVYYRVRNGEEIASSDYEKYGEDARVHAEKAQQDARSVPPSSGSFTSQVKGQGGQTSFAGATTRPPSVIGPYSLLRELGEGGMGTVWLAEQEEPVKRQVALKLIRPELASKEIAARFDAEKRALARMDHPNIARVLDAGTTDDNRPYFVMELVNGVPITQYCDDNKLSVDDRLKLFVPVCKAIQHAHQKGVIHRDIKPSNILITVTDDEAIPKVIDFGLAKEHNPSLTDEGLTEFGRVVGTVQYMSPEQAEMNRQDVDTQTDVYSLGVMLYELLTGSTPLDKETLCGNALLQVLKIIRENDPPRPSARLTSTSHKATSVVSDRRQIHVARLQQILEGELDWVVMRALEKDRSRRYQTANDFAQDVSNYLTGATVNARPPSTWYQLQKFATRNRGLVASALAISVVLIAGILGTSYGLIRANEKADEAQASEDRAIAERDNAQRNEKRAIAAELEASREAQRATEAERKAESEADRAIGAEEIASNEAQRARDAEAAAKFQLAVARWDADRALEARSLLHQIPQEYRGTFEWHLCNRRFQGSDITCYGHTGTFGFGGVYEVVFSPDGSWVASASGDHTIKLWDAITGQELATLSGHEDGIVDLAISADGSQLASCGYDRTIKLWDVASPQEVLTLTGHSGTVHGVAFSPDGAQLASASFDKTVRLWDVKTGEETSSITGHSGDVLDVAFSPDGSQLASACRGKTVRIWNCETGELIKQLVGARLEFQSIAFSPDGTRLVATTYARFEMWNTETWERLSNEQGEHDRYVHCVAFSPDGTQFATGGEDATIKLWDTQSAQMVSTFTGHSGPVRGICFSADGTRLVSGGRNRTVKIWNVSGGNDLTFGGHAKQTICVAFGPQGTKIASAAGDGSIFLRDLTTNEVLFELRGHSGSVNDVAFSPDGTKLASAGADRTVRLWNTQTGEKICTIRHPHWVRGVAFSPDGSQLASAVWDGTVRLWSTESHEETAVLKGHRAGVYCVVFSPDGGQLASSSIDRTIKLWDAEKGEEIRTLRGHVNRVRSVAFGPEGKRIASTGNDGTVRIWDVDSGEQTVTAGGGNAIFFDLAFSPDGKRVAACNTDRTVNLFDAQDGTEIMSLFAGDGGVSGVAFNADGTRLAASVHDGTVRVWDARPQHDSILLSGHNSLVSNVSFSENGNRIFSQAGKQKFVWDTSTRERLPNATWDPPKQHTQRSPDGRWFVTMEANNVVLVDVGSQLPSPNAGVPAQDARLIETATAKNK